MRGKLLFLLLFVVCTLGCNKKQEVEKTKEKSSFKMYQMSEMAALMESMYANTAAIKALIVEGSTESLGEFPLLHENLHTAILTDPSDRDMFFEASAKHFLEKERELYAALPEDRVVKLNELVDSCLACHQKKCGGPIPRIKKLYIK
ncbi:hypothetical protein [Myroides injenensis]|uniref:hypothetical protein n=1 Tax=Myroides injenensis TaxID=1183151 RepID=UPI000287D307|nr:hypothetical protein [Myroides injenensis]